MSVLPVTLFTTCKPFRGETGIMQENALRSWARLDQPILVFGDEHGAAELCRQIGARHIAGIRRSDNGTPLLNHLFEQAKHLCDTEYLAYVNADIILRDNFIDALRQLDAEPIAATRPLITSRRQNIPLNRPIFRGAHPDRELDLLIERYASWDSANAIDLFIFHRKQLTDIPPFSIGRTQWDNWLLWKAREEGADVIDASESLSLLHPIHGYASHSSGWQQVTQGAEAQENRRLAENHLLTIDTASTYEFHNRQLTVCSAEGDPTRFCPQRDKLLLGGLEYLLAGFEQRPIEETADAIRNLLWMCDAYFPIDTTSRYTPKQIKKHLLEARAAIDGGDLQRGINRLQDLLVDKIIEIAESIKRDNRPLIIWGCGQMGRRLQTLLDRLHIPFYGFLDSSVNTGDRTVNGKPVIANRWQDIKHQFDTTPFIVIASMYYRDIAGNLQILGLMPDQDYMA